MTDQDGVVLDVNYQATLDECGFQRCRELSEELTLVPNSDTPVARLLNNFRNALGLQLTAAIEGPAPSIDVGDRRKGSCNSLGHCLPPFDVYP